MWASLRRTRTIRQQKKKGARTDGWMDRWMGSFFNPIQFIIPFCVCLCVCVCITIAGWWWWWWWRWVGRGARWWWLCGRRINIIHPDPPAAARQRNKQMNIVKTTHQLIDSHRRLHPPSLMMVSCGTDLFIYLFFSHSISFFCCLLSKSNAPSWFWYDWHCISRRRRLLNGCTAARLHGCCRVNCCDDDLHPRPLPSPPLTSSFD